MNSLIPDGLTVSPALEALRLALSHLSPVEAVALTVAMVALVVSAATIRRQPLTLNDRNVRDAGLTPGEARR